MATTAAEGTSTAATPTSTISVDAGSLTGVNIIFMYPWTGDTARTVEEMVSEFNSTNEWGIRVTTDAPGSASAMAEQIDYDLQNFAPPEVIAAPIDYLLRLNKTEKVVADLTPYVESAAWGMTEDDLDYFADVFWQQDEVDGYRYGVPAQRTAKVMFYNKTWANELGYTDYPLTINEFEQQVCDVAGRLKLDGDVTNDGLGGWIIDMDDMTIASWLLAFDSQVYVKNKITFANEQTVSAFSFLRSLYDNNCAWISSNPDPYAYFSKRQALVYSGDLQDMYLQKQAQTMAGSTDEWVVLPFPTENGSFLLAEGPSYAVLATTEEKKLAAWLFVRWMSNPDNQGKIVKASGSLPLSEKSVQYAIELEDSLPQWFGVASLLDYVKVAPSTAEWSNAAIVMEDASWQLFKTDIKNEEIPDLVALMDQTMKEFNTESQ